MILDLDLRLIDIKLELSALNDQFYIIESNVKRLIDEEHSKLEEKRGKGFFRDEEDLISELQEVHHKIDIFYPRIFWSPFIVSVYSVFEASMLEIADELKDKKKVKLGIDDLSGNLLDKAKKYFEHILNFPLVVENEQWSKLKNLAVVRNAIAHTNGRIDRLKKTNKDKIYELEEKNIGISGWMNLLVIEPVFAKTCLDVVSVTVNDLCVRYKSYDNSTRLRLKEV